MTVRLKSHFLLLTFQESEEQSGQRPEAILADNGYCSDKNLEFLESADEPENKIEGFIATGMAEHGEHRLPPKPGPLPEGATPVDRMKKKLRTKAGPSPPARGSLGFYRLARAARTLSRSTSAPSSFALPTT